MPVSAADHPSIHYPAQSALMIPPSTRNELPFTAPFFARSSAASAISSHWFDDMGAIISIIVDLSPNCAASEL
jgi:hypothetical protein